MNKYSWDTLYPYGVGIDSMLSALDTLSTKNTSYPPYNILKRDSSNYEIEIALAGFTREEIEVSSESNILKVTSKVAGTDPKVEYLHKGVSRRSFTESWQLADDVRVVDVAFNDGLLIISLEKIIPDHMKRTTYEVK